MFIYVYFALKLVIKMKGWSCSFVRRVAVRTEASIYGDTSRHIKERQNSIYDLNFLKKKWNDLLYRYNYIVEVERFYRNR